MMPNDKVVMQLLNDLKQRLHTFEGWLLLMAVILAIFGLVHIAVIVALVAK